jgi:enoyl-CoA hydratase/carnithine racemase
MSYEFIQITREGPITIITLNRPEVMNALHAAGQFEVDRAVDEFAADPDQWVAIITGAGDRAFCAGGDLKALATEKVDPGRPVGRRPKRGFAGMAARFDLAKPVIAAVNGLAFGGGFEMALGCDLILASEAASFCLPEPRRGLVALSGGVLRLTRDIGAKRALGVILTARKVTAGEGLELGFVTAVVPSGELMPTALDWARQICELSPMAVRAAKEVAYRGLTEPSLEVALKAQLQYPAVKALIASEDFKEGPRAFAEKRPPLWKGR